MRLLLKENINLNSSPIYYLSSPLNFAAHSFSLKLKHLITIYLLLLKLKLPYFPKNKSLVK